MPECEVLSTTMKVAKLIPHPVVQRQCFQDVLQNVKSIQGVAHQFCGAMRPVSLPRAFRVGLRSRSWVNFEHFDGILSCQIKGMSKTANPACGNDELAREVIFAACGKSFYHCLVVVCTVSCDTKELHQMN